jgi:hypothetical protein
MGRSEARSIKASKSVQGSKYASKSIEASSGQPNIRCIQATKHQSERVAELAAASKGAKPPGQQREWIKTSHYPNDQRSKRVAEPQHASEQNQPSKHRSDGMSNCPVSEEVSKQASKKHLSDRQNRIDKHRIRMSNCPSDQISGRASIGASMIEARKSIRSSVKKATKHPMIEATKDRPIIEATRRERWIQATKTFERSAGVEASQQHEPGVSVQDRLVVRNASKVDESIERWLRKDGS